jgi:hypothetical protein
LNSENDVEEAAGSDTSAAGENELRDDASVHDEVEDDGGFGDDFDDFEEGGEGDDFGDFDDGFQQGEEQAETTFDESPDHPSVPAPSPGPVSQNMQSHIDLCFDACVLQ